MQITSSIRILFQLATKVKWISETELITFMNSTYLKQIKYIDEFYNTFSYPTAVSGICQDMLIVYSCSFIDEYENEFTSSKFPKEANRILELKRITLPAYKQIKKWKDLKKIRNNIIAHNHRINGKSIFNNKDKITYNIPATNEEYTLLADLVFIIAENIPPIFPELITEIDFNESLRDHLNIKSEKINTFNVYRQIKKEIEVNKNCP
jgi:hypothetical protein